MSDVSFRMALCLALAHHAEQPLTRDIARQIVEGLFPDRSIDPTRFPPSQCGTLAFQVEQLSQIVPELQVLHEAHWAETEGYLRGLALNMDYEALIEEERAGSMIQFTARCGGQLVGNFRLYLRVSRHTQTKLAVEDTLFLLAEHRRGRNALRFLDYAGKALRSLGYREFRASTKFANPAAARLLEFRGFKPVATEYVLFEPQGDSQ